MSRTMRMFPLALLAALVLAACGGSQEAPAAATAAAPTAATVAATEAAPASAAETATEAAAGPVSGQRTFVIVPEQSKASYIVDESFFGGALAFHG